MGEVMHECRLHHRWVHLNRAYLCLDCDAVLVDPHGCPACGSRALMPLQSLVDRTGWRAPDKGSV